MNLGGSAGGAAPEMTLDDLQRMEAMFARVRDACFQKCIHRFDESSVSLGEGSCVDRCVVKYMKVFEKVGARLSPAPLGMPPH